MRAMVTNEANRQYIQAAQFKASCIKEIWYRPLRLELYSDKCSPNIVLHTFFQSGEVSVLCVNDLTLRAYSISVLQMIRSIILHMSRSHGQQVGHWSEIILHTAHVFIDPNRGVLFQIMSLPVPPNGPTCHNRIRSKLQVRFPCWFCNIDQWDALKQKGFRCFWGKPFYQIM